MESYLGIGSPVASRINNYEYRRQQIEMAESVQAAIIHNKHLMVEAGCGVGKSFAYLVPFMLWVTMQDKKKVVISTYTKALQQQLIDKDIPFLAGALDMDVKAVLCVGSRNYLCLRRLDNSWGTRLLDTESEVKQLQRLYDWASQTEDGLRFNLDFKVSDNLWADVCRTPDICKDRSCAFYKRCFFYKARKEQLTADILILNHHLLFSDIASGGKVFPKYHAVVFDEAQNMEDVASDTLSLSVSRHGIKYLLSRIYKSGSTRCLAARYEKSIKEFKRPVMDRVNAVKRKTDSFFTDILDEFGLKDTSYRIHVRDMFPNTLSDPLVELSVLLSDISLKTEDDEAKMEFKYYSVLCKNMAENLKIILSMGFENYVYYLKIKARHHNVYCSFNATPVDVAELLDKMVFKPISPVILTSATLTVNSSFDFIRKRVGLAEPLEKRVDSPFNYRENVLLYTPTDLPDPSYDLDAFQEATVDRISELLVITGGRTFILFTSYAMLNKSAEELVNRFPKLNFLVHGEMSQNRILKDFAKKPGSVLLGTTTFWQGVDFPGRALECVILTKLPFSVPDDPITEARIENIRKYERDPFMTYQVPIATLLFKQGFGRLIRHRKDFGIVAVLDPRVKTRRYGRIFLDSLPECNRITDIRELAENYKYLCDKYAPDAV
ncbi:MAG: helicase c2 [Elusimicrobia bacterium]|nr:helicase c2 [Elusimicrobiota bacterium]